MWGEGYERYRYRDHPRTGNEPIPQSTRAGPTKVQELEYTSAQATEALTRMDHPLFPAELVAKILDHTVLAQRHRIFLDGSIDLKTYAHEHLIEPCAISSHFHLAAEEAVLRKGLFQFEPVFKRTAGGASVLQLPAWLAGHASLVRHLVIKVKAPAGSDLIWNEPYPKNIYLATDGMASLAEHFPSLRSCHLRLTIELRGLQAVLSGNSLWNFGCRKGVKDHSTMAAVTESLIGSFVAHGPGKGRSLRIEHCRLDQGLMACSKVVPVPTRSSGPVEQPSMDENGARVESEVAAETPAHRIFQAATVQVPGLRPDCDC